VIGSTRSRRGCVSGRSPHAPPYRTRHVPDAVPASEAGPQQERINSTSVASSNLRTIIEIARPLDGGRGWGAALMRLNANGERPSGRILAMSRMLAALVSLALLGLPACADDYGRATEPSPPHSPPPVAAIGRDVAVAGDLSCAIGDDARVRCWGSYPQPALEAPRPFGPTPTLVPGVPEATAIAVDASRACAVATSGEVYCWGDNSHGELGAPPDDVIHIDAVRVGVLSAAAVDVVIGQTTGCALLTTGQVACWGDDTFTALPVPASASYGAVLVPDLGDATLLRGGGHTTCAARRDGTVLCWGEPSYGQAGPRDGARVHAIAMPPVRDLLVGAPTLEASFALTTDGGLYQWGQGVEPRGVAARIGAMRGDRLVGGWTRVCGLDDVGTLDCIRPNEPWVSSAPIVEHLLEGLPPVRSLSIGDRHECMLAMDDTLLCRGSNGRGQSAMHVVGNASASDLRLVTNDARSVARGGDYNGQFACALSGTDLLCWGDGLQGQLGTGVSTVSATPVRVPIDSPTALAVGATDACAISGGAVWCWGANTHGVADPTSAAAVLSPVRIGIPPATAIALGHMHACALTADGVYCWGNDEHAEASAGAYADRQPPTRVIVEDVVAISAGASHTCALRTDGTLACWGDNRDHQIGAPIFDEESEAAVRAGHATALQTVRTPRTLAWVGGATSVHAAGNTTCAAVGGTSTCWPGVGMAFATVALTDAIPLADGGGACGGTPLECLAMGSGPLRAIDLPAIQDERVWTMDAHDGCAIDAHDALHCWGTNDVGELGDGTGWAETPTPVRW